MRGVVVLMLCSVSVSGCADDAEQRRANGVDRQLSFGGTYDGIFYALLPTHVPRTVNVTRHVDMENTEAVVVEHAVCEPVPCDFSFEPSRFRISSKTAGTTRLRVTVRRIRDGATFSDAVDVTFADAKRIALERDHVGLMPMVMPISPGVRFEAPFAVLRDAQDRYLSPDPDAVVFTVEGTSVGHDPDHSDSSYLVAKEPGITSLKWALPGQLETKVDIEVIGSPAALQTIVVRRVPPAAGGVTELDDVRALLAEPPLDVVELPATDRAFVRLLAHGVLTDGRSVLLEDYAPLLTSIGEARSERDPWQVVVEAFGTPGETTLRLGPQNARTSIPVRFISP